MKSSERCLLLTIHRHQYVSYQHGQLQITDHLSVTYSQCCIFVLLGPSAVYSQSCYQFQFMVGDYDKLLVNIGGDHLEKGINTNFISVSIRYAVLCQGRQKWWRVFVQLPDRVSQKQPAQSSLYDPNGRVLQVDFDIIPCSTPWPISAVSLMHIILSVFAHFLHHLLWAAQAFQMVSCSLCTVSCSHLCVGLLDLLWQKGLDWIQTASLVWTECSSKAAFKQQN